MFITMNINAMDLNLVEYKSVLEALTSTIDTWNKEFQEELKEVDFPERKYMTKTNIPVRPTNPNIKTNINWSHLNFAQENALELAWNWADWTNWVLGYEWLTRVNLSALEILGQAAILAKANGTQNVRGVLRILLENAEFDLRWGWQTYAPNRVTSIIG